jgi:hypothetical protein
MNVERTRHRLAKSHNTGIHPFLDHVRSAEEPDENRFSVFIPSILHRNMAGQLSPGTAALSHAAKTI